MGCAIMKDRAMPDTHAKHPPPDSALTLAVGDALIPLRRVVSTTSLSPATIYRRLADNTDPFPRPLRVGGRTLWVASEVAAWVRAQAVTAPRVGAQPELFTT